MKSVGNWVFSARKRLCCALLSSLCTTTQSKSPLKQLGKARAAALAGGEGARTWTLLGKRCLY